MTEGYHLKGGYQLPILLLTDPEPATHEGQDEAEQLSPIGDKGRLRPSADPEVGP
ncbi:hypothetical protein ACIOWI_30250 [Streptomyces sp. NPDC087659]|uniref:hypothetical protein n=1 Tax=Streptomyces sp. NPDC087659 TaxID=3365801 RepID=UPI00382DF61A